MTTLGGLVTEIQSSLFDDAGTAVTAAEIRTAINDAIRHYKDNEYWFNTSESDFTISEDDTTVSLPSNFYMPMQRDTLRVVYSNETYEVRKVKPHIFASMNYSETTGRPAIYTIRDGGIEFWPKADRDYSATLHYIKDNSDFATNGDDDSNENDFTTNAPALVRYEALKRLYLTKRQDMNMSAIYADMANSEEKAIRRATNQRNATGTLTVQQ